MWIQFIQGFFPIKHETRKCYFLSLYFPPSPCCCRMRGLVVAQEQNHINLSHGLGLKKGNQHLAFFFFFFLLFVCPLVGNPEKCVLFFALDLTEARSLLKIMSFPVVSNSISMAGLHFQPQCLVNTQFLDTLCFPSPLGSSSLPLASFTEEHGFLGSLCLQPFSNDIKGPLSSFEGCGHCQNPHKPGSLWGQFRQLAPVHTRMADCRGSLYMELAEFPWMKGRLI